MRLINAFTRQLGGTLDVSSAEPGTRFLVVVPIKDALDEMLAGNEAKPAGSG